jgi:hypothetical protein
MFDPKTIYENLNIKEIIGPELAFQLELKDWPANELATIHVATWDGRGAYVLIAPESTVESVEKELRRVAARLRGSTRSCGGDACGL